MLIGLAFVAGLMSSLHCMGMCGPLALFVTKGSGGTGTSWKYMLPYHGGRIYIYLSLGVVVNMFQMAIPSPKWQQGVSILTGCLLILFAFQTKGLKKYLSQGVFNFYQNIRRTFQIDLHKHVFLAGMLNGILPCGAVYIALSMAIASASTLEAVGVMAAFGLGTLPVFVFLFMGTSWLTKPAFSQKILMVFSVGIGCLLILRGLDLGIPYLSPGLQGQGAGEITNCEP